MTLASGLATALPLFEQAVASGWVTSEVVTGLQAVAALSPEGPIEERARLLAARAVHLHQLGLPVLPQVRRLLAPPPEALSEAPDPQLLEVLRAVQSEDSRPARETGTVTAFLPDRDLSLSLVIPPSIFPPGNWTRTFVDALMKPASLRRYRGRSGIELGTGSGVVAMSLVMKGAAWMLGLDLNPDAILTSLINVYLNVPSERRGSFFFKKSDLLDSLGFSMKYDFVVGCLPQVVVLGRQGVGKRQIADVYTGSGDLEDLFGFGLLSRALRESHLHLKEDGWVEFIVSGRLGRQTALELFERNGYRPVVNHQARIPQDPDPPMSAFAKLEETRGIRFQFYVPGSARPVSAREAIGFPPDQITHDLFVIRGFPFRTFERRSAERFLGRVPSNLGYTDDPGTEMEVLRRAIADDYQSATGIGVDPSVVFIGPSAAELLLNLIQAVVPGGGRVLYSRRNWQRFEKSRQLAIRSSPLVAEDSFDDVLRQMEANRPAVVVFNIGVRDRSNWEGLRQIAALALQQGTRLVLAGLLHTPSPEGDYLVARLLKEMPEIASHLIVLNDLKRRLNLSTEVAYALIPDRSLYEAMARLGEAGYSRTPTVGQAVAAQLLKGQPRRKDLVVPLAAVSGTLPVAEHVRGLARFPSMQPSPPATHSDPIRMEFGQSEWPVPEVVLEGALRALRAGPGEDLEGAAVEGARRYLRKSRGIEAREIIAGPGVLPLQAAALRAVSRRSHHRTQVILPRPAYDVHFPMVGVWGGFTASLRTEQTKIPPSFLGSARRGSDPTVLLLTQPTNPGGQYYTEGELRALREAGPGAVVFSDEVFGLLTSPEARLVSPAALPKEAGAWDGIVTFFGLSKEVGKAGGLRAGFAATDDSELAREIRRQIPTPIDRIALGAAAAFFENWEQILTGHRRWLDGKRGELEGFLREAGIPFLPSQGGLGTLVDLSVLYGRKVRGTVITKENIAGLLGQETGIIIRPPGWGDTEQVRMVYSIRRLDEALSRLRNFPGFTMP